MTVFGNILDFDIPILGRISRRMDCERELKMDKEIELEIEKDEPDIKKLIENMRQRR